MLPIRFAAATILALCWASHGFAGGWPPTAADVSVTLSRGNDGCLEGNDCRLAIQVENLGTAPFGGGLSVVIETAAPSVPGFAGSGLWSCERLAYGRMACSAASVDLSPSQTLTGLVSVRFLPTIMSDAQACASVDWRASTGTIDMDAVRSVAAALGRETPAGPGAARLLSAVFGNWGSGDLRAGNDRGCVTVSIGTAPAGAHCPEGRDRIAGGCIALDAFCSGGRKRIAKGGACACPVQAEVFDPVSRICAAAATPACDGGRAAKDGLCFCPEARPLWNAATSRCEEWRAPEPAAATVESEAPPAPIVKPIPKARGKKAIAPVKEKIASKPSCGSGETLRGDACVKIGARPARKPRAQPVARKDFENPSAVWRREASRCPPILAYCWVKVIRAYSKSKRRARGR